MFRCFYIAVTRYFDPSISPEPHLRKFHIPAHPDSLPTCIHLPNSYSSDTSANHPVLINIHDGGVILVDPSLDSNICTHLLGQLGFLHSRVAQLQNGVRKSVSRSARRRKGRHSRTRRCQVSLIDVSNIVLMGSSAGGTLALAACLSPKICALRIKAVVPVISITGLTSLTLGKPTRLASRPPGEDVLADIGTCIAAYMRDSAASPWTPDIC